VVEPLWSHVSAAFNCFFSFFFHRPRQAKEMSSVASKPASEKGKVKGMFKRLTIRLKRKGDKHKGDQEEEQQQHNLGEGDDEVEVPGPDAKQHMKKMLGTEDIDDHGHAEAEEEVGKAKAKSGDKKQHRKKKNKVEHLLRRSRKYQLTKSASRGRLTEGDGEEAGDVSKGKEEDSDANIQVVAEAPKTKEEKKEEKKREKKERKEKRKSRRKSTNKPSAPAVDGEPVGQNDPPRPLLAKESGGEAVELVATGRPSNSGFARRPLSSPPQRFNGEVRTITLPPSLWQTFIDQRNCFLFIYSGVKLRFACDRGCHQGRRRVHRSRTPVHRPADDARTKCPPPSLPCRARTHLPPSCRPPLSRASRPRTAPRWDSSG
jgi:hypothetical protein